MEAISVKELKKLCEREILKGNGEKAIMISSDDEGNSYHYLWYGFETIENYEKPIKIGETEIQIEFDYTDDKENTIILG